MQTGEHSRSGEGAPTVFRYVLCERTPIAFRHDSVDEAVRAASSDPDCTTVGIEVIPPESAWADARVIGVDTAEWNRLASSAAGPPPEAEVPPEDRPFTLYLRTPSWVWARLAGYDSRSAAESALADLIDVVGPYRARLSESADD